MNASIKRDPKSKVREIQQLESKISNLQSQYQNLLNQRQQEIASLICTVDLPHLDDKILIGGLLFLKEKVSTQDSMMEAWRDAGEKFLRRGKTKLFSRESAGDCPQIPGKNVPSKETPAPQATPQSPQKLPQQRET